MRIRPASRILLLDPANRVLLFRFAFDSGALAGTDYWATPGGGLEPGETHAAAARRELFDETGLVVQEVGPEVGRHGFAMRLMSGEEVWAEERFFLVRTASLVLSRANWTADEVSVIADHRWWTLDEIDRRRVQIWPEDIAALVRGALSEADGG